MSKRVSYYWEVRVIKNPTHPVSEVTHRTKYDRLPKYLRLRPDECLALVRKDLIWNSTQSVTVFAQCLPEKFTVKPAHLDAEVIPARFRAELVRARVNHVRIKYAVAFVEGDASVGLDEQQWKIELNLPELRLTKQYDLDYLNDLRKSIATVYATISGENPKVLFDYELPGGGAL